MVKPVRSRPNTIATLCWLASLMSFSPHSRGSSIGHSRVRERALVPTTNPQSATAASSVG
ncbi:Uncharacterised protein [Vibrio cholerae]|nr:Uncharacterised protein [Vibrio cholerae]